MLLVPRSSAVASGWCEGRCLVGCCVLLLLLFTVCTEHGHYCMGFCSLPCFDAPFHEQAIKWNLKKSCSFKEVKTNIQRAFYVFLLCTSNAFLYRIESELLYIWRKKCPITNKGSNLLAYDFAYDLHVNGLMSKHTVIYLSLFYSLYCQDGLISLIKMNS